jgi:hypothetical protein
MLLKSIAIFPGNGAKMLVTIIAQLISNNQVKHKLSTQGSLLFQRYLRTVYAQFQKQLVL